jgi:hypothetical protein
MRKGVLYSIFTLFLVVPIVMLIISYSSVLKVEGGNTALRVRADSMKYFYDSVSDDLGRVLLISAKRSVLHLINVVLTTGAPSSNSEEKLSEMIEYGTLNGQDVPELTGTDEFPCNTVECWVSSTEFISEKDFGLRISIDPVSIDVMPYDSWNLKVIAKVKVNLRDDYMNMSINSTVNKIVIVPIFGFEDPLYPLNTYGKISKFVQRSSVNTIASGTVGLGWAVGEVARTLGAGNRSSKIFVTDQDLSSFNIADLNGFAGIVSSVSSVPSGLQKPFIIVSSSSGLTEGRNVYFDNITFGVWDLITEIMGGYYHESYYGPSFLDRLEGRTYISDEFKSQSSAVIGLLGFLNFDAMSSSGIAIDRSKSCVDYVYFGGYGGNPC